MALHLIDHQDGDRLVFSTEVSHHMIRSLRKKAGDEIYATDGHGTIFSARIEPGNDRQIQATIMRQEVLSKNWEVHVACSLIKKESRFEYFLEKATEIGVSRITPLICERTLKPGLRQDRAQKIIDAAVQQSFNPYVPILDRPEALEDFLSRDFPDHHEKYIASAVERSQHTTLEQQYSGKNPVHILIGPEGDFTPSEVDVALGHGWTPVSLGQNRLRTDTAATMVVQIIKSCYHMKTPATT